MFGRQFNLFKLFGFQIRMDLSWFFIAILISWSLATLFMQMYPELNAAVRWTMGITGALGLFASVTLHELGHSIVARRHGLSITGITLFIFGGVAEMQEEPRSAKTEFYVAAAGPLVSVMISIVFSLLSAWGHLLNWPLPVLAMTGYFAVVNTMLVLFNLIPAFPLDGGRVLRSALWYWKSNLRWATRVTTLIGAGFGIVFVMLGVYLMILGNVIGGLWWCLIGLFLRKAAMMSYQQLLVRRALEGEPVRRFMRSQPVTVPAELSVQELVDQYIYQHHYKMYPVIGGGELKGCVSTRDIKAIEREEWPQKRVEEIVQPCGPENTVSPEQDAMQVIAKMNRTGISRMMVVGGGELLGIITLKDLMGFLANKIELGDEEGTFAGTDSV